MDRLHFDAIARLLATTGSRRRTLGALLGAALLGQSVEAHAKPGGKKRNKDRGKQRGHGKAKNNRRRKTKAQASPPGSCFGSGACVPGPAAYLAKCDFSDSTVLAGANCSKSNLSDSSLLRANAAGTNFTKANLGKVCFVDANLTGATFSNTNLQGAVFCRTTMPNGSTNNSGCSKSSKCCQTCIEVGNACGAGVGGSCCGEAECDGGVCTCDLPLIDCNGVCQECCDDGDCTDVETPNCCGGTCRACCNDGDCPDATCQTGDCTAANICAFVNSPDNQSGPNCGPPEVCCDAVCCGTDEECLDSLCCLPGTTTSGDVTPLAGGEYLMTTQGTSAFGALRIDVAAGTTFGDIVYMASDFDFAVGTCTAGTPRFVVFLTTGRCPYAAFPPGGDCADGVGNTGNLIGNDVPFVWNDDLCAGSGLGTNTYTEVNALYAAVTIDRIVLVVDESGGEQEVTVQPCVSTVGPPPIIIG